MPPASLRDVRLDLFRGLAMFIIFVAHVPNNRWADFLPRSLGPSDAAEWFVACSGFASALAFGKVFEQQGWLIGTSRILHRLWQLYWAQIAVFLLVATLSVWGTRQLDTRDYVALLNLTPFFAEPETGLLHLLTLTYVPNLFDILPMYMVVLAMVPLVMALHRLHPLAAMAFPPILYLLARAFDWNLPAEWWTDRPWYFNPFTWQLLFFTGFAFGRGWLRRPPTTVPLIAAAVLVLVVLFVFKFDPIWHNVGWVNHVSNGTVWMIDKTDFGPARYLHVLAIGYLALILLDRFPSILRSPAINPIVLVGQQTLAVFLSTLVLSWSAGMALDVLGRSGWSLALVNLTGFAAMVAVARTVAFYKASPWRRPRHRLHEGAAEGASTRAAPVPGE